MSHRNHKKTENSSGESVLETIKIIQQQYTRGNSLSKIEFSSGRAKPLLGRCPLLHGKSLLAQSSRPPKDDTSFESSWDSSMTSLVIG